MNGGIGSPTKQPNRSSSALLQLGPDPRTLAALTVHEYVLPFVRPETTSGAFAFGAEAEPLTPPSDDVHDA